MAGRLNTREQAKRNEKIVAMRAARVPWSQIAAEFGLTVRGCEFIVSKWEKDAPPAGSDGDGQLQLMEFIAGLEMARDQFVIHGLTAEYEAHRIGALKAYVETAALIWQVKRDANLVPRNPAAPMLGQELQVLFRELGELMRRHKIEDEILDAFRELAQQHMRAAAIHVRGRELPDAA